jgi:hypothetical protein
LDEIFEAQLEGLFTGEEEAMAHLDQILQQRERSAG